MITIENLILFIKNNKKLSIFLGICLFILFCVLYFLTLPKSNTDNTDYGITPSPTPSYKDYKQYNFEKDFKNLYAESKAIINSNTLLNKYSTKAFYTSQEVENIRDDYYLISYVNYTFAELKDLFGDGVEISGNMNQITLKKSANSLSKLNLLNVYMDILNKNNIGLVYKVNYVTQKYIELSGGTYVPSYIDETTDTLATYYNLYLNNNPFTIPLGSFRIYHSKNTKNGEEKLIVPNYLPKNLEKKYFSLPEFTTSNIFAFYYDGMGYSALSYYGPVNFEIKDVTIFPNSGSVVHVLDTNNSVVIPYIAKQGRINDEINGKILPDKLYLIAK